MNRHIARLWPRAPPCPRCTETVARHPPIVARYLQTQRRRPAEGSIDQGALYGETEGGNESGNQLAIKEGMQAKALRHAKMELAWLPNKAALAQRIERGLKDGKYELCLAMARLASKEKDSAIAAWNLIIRHRMDEKPIPHFSAAMDLFNEVSRV